MARRLTISHPIDSDMSTKKGKPKTTPSQSNIFAKFQGSRLTVGNENTHPLQL